MTVSRRAPRRGLFTELLQAHPHECRICRQMSYADIHFHLLPGVDDGPSSMDESVALAAAAVADGTSVVVATPHVRPGFLTDVSELPDRVRELEDRLAREQIGLAVRRGAELGHDMVGRLSQAELDSVAHGPLGA